MTYQQYMASQEWREIRRYVLKRDHYRCRECHGKARKDDPLTVHHKHGWVDGRIDNLKDLETVHRSCHDNIHYRVKPKRFKTVWGYRWVNGRRTKERVKTVIPIFV
jgi:5-methylcytosine-specific restriction endonuclease McrA